MITVNPAKDYTESRYQQILRKYRENPGADFTIDDCTEALLYRLRLGIQRKEIVAKDIQFAAPDGSYLTPTQKGEFYVWPDGFYDVQEELLTQLLRGMTSES